MAALFLELHGKAYYIVPIYPTFLAGGAVAIEERFAWKPFTRGAVLATVTAIGVLLAPLALPILPPEKYPSSDAASLGIRSGAASSERGQQGSLPSQLAGMFGWPEMAAKVSAVYNALPSDERARAVFYGRDYGEAAALNIYGPALNGPPVVAGNNNYFLWGPIAIRRLCRDCPGWRCYAVDEYGGAQDLAAMRPALWPLLLAISIWWGWGNVAEPKGQERSVTQTPYFRCFFDRFPDGDVLSEKSAKEGRGDFSSPDDAGGPTGLYGRL